MDNKRISEISITDVKENTVQFPTAVVFDWDNTLKQYNPERRSINCGVDKDILLKWKNDLKCTLYIISAIKPTKINMETILIEVARLNLTDVFIDKNDEIQIVPNKYARKGNVIICGYDKAETFLDIFHGDAGKTVFGSDTVDHADMVDGGDTQARAPGVSQGNKSAPVIFFDDERVNIDNFSQIVTDSVCYHIV